MGKINLNKKYLTFGIMFLCIFGILTFAFIQNVKGQDNLIEIGSFDINGEKLIVSSNSFNSESETSNPIFYGWQKSEILGTEYSDLREFFDENEWKDDFLSISSPNLSEDDKLYLFLTYYSDEYPDGIVLDDGSLILSNLDNVSSLSDNDYSSKISKDISLTELGDSISNSFSEVINDLDNFNLELEIRYVNSQSPADYESFKKTINFVKAPSVKISLTGPVDDDSNVITYYNLDDSVSDFETYFTISASGYLDSDTVSIGAKNYNALYDGTIVSDSNFSLSEYYTNLIKDNNLNKLTDKNNTVLSFKLPLFNKKLNKSYTKEISIDLFNYENVKEYEKPSITIQDYNGDEFSGIIYSKDVDNDKKAFLNVDFNQGIVHREYKVYAKNSELENSRILLFDSLLSDVTQNVKIDLSDAFGTNKNLYLNGTYTFEYEIYDSSLESPSEDKVYLSLSDEEVSITKNTAPTINKTNDLSDEDLEIGDDANNKKFYGDNVPESYKTYLIIPVNDVDDDSVILVSNETEYLPDENGNVKIDLSNLITESNNEFKFTLTDGIKTTSEFVYVATDFEPYSENQEPEELSILGNISGDGIRYTNKVDDKPVLNISFNKGIYDNAVYSIIANDGNEDIVIIEDSDKKTDSIDLSETFDGNYLDGTYTFKYTITGDENIPAEDTSGVLLSDVIFKENNPKVEMSISGEYLDSESTDSEDTSLAKLLINVDENSINTDSYSLAVFVKKYDSDSYEDLGIFNDSDSIEINISEKIFETGDYIFKYVLNDGICTIEEESEKISLHKARLSLFAEIKLKNTLTTNEDTIYYTNKVDDKPILNISFDKGKYEDAVYTAYLENNETLERIDLVDKSSSDESLDLSKDFNSNYLDGTYTLKYEASATDITEIEAAGTLLSNIKFKENNPKIEASIIGTYLDLDNPNSENSSLAKVSITIDKDSIIDANTFTLDVFAKKTGSNDFEKLESFDNTDDININLSEKLTEAGEYTFKYILNDGIATIEEEFGTISLSLFSSKLGISGNISGNGIKYTNKVDDKPILNISFNKGIYDNAVYSIIASNGTEDISIINDSEKAIDSIDLSGIFDENYLNGTYTFKYTITGDENIPAEDASGVLLSDVIFKENNPEINASVTGEYLDLENPDSEDDSLAKLAINIKEDSINSDNFSLEVLVRKPNSDNFEQLDIFNNNYDVNINLSEKLTEAGDYVFKYILTDGICTIEEEFGKISLELFSSKLSILGNISGDEIKYTNKVDDKPILKISFNKGKYDSAIYSIIANDGTKDIVIIENSNKETDSTDLSETFDGNYLDGTYTFKYTITGDENIPAEDASGVLLSDVIFKENNPKVKFSITGTYLDLENPDSEDGFLAKLFINVDENSVINVKDLSLEVLAKNSEDVDFISLISYNGENAINDKNEINLSEKLISAGEYTFKYVLKDGITTIEEEFKTVILEDFKDSLPEISLTIDDKDINFYGKNVPEDLRTYLNFRITKETSYQNLSLEIYSYKLDEDNSRIEDSKALIGKFDGEEIREGKIDLTSNLDYSKYDFSYRLSRNDKVEEKDIAEVVIFEEFRSPVITGSFDRLGEIDGIYYSGTVDKNNYLDISFDKGSLSSSRFEIYANDVLLNNQSQGNISTSFNLSSVKYPIGNENANFLNGDIVFKYKIYYGENIFSEGFLNETVFPFKTNVFPEVENFLKINNYDEDNYYYREDSINVPESQSTYLDVVLDDSLSDEFLSELTLSLYGQYEDGDKFSMGVFSGNSIRGTSIDLSNNGIVSQDGNYTFSYELTNNVKTYKKNIGTYSFTSFKQGSISVDISGGINGNYYTKDVRNDGQTFINVSVEPGNFKDISYKVYAEDASNQILICEKTYSGEGDKNIGYNLSNQFNENYLNGSYKFRYEFNYSGKTISQYLDGDYVFIENSKPNISNTTSFVYSQKDDISLSNFYFGDNIPENEKAILKVVPFDDGFYYSDKLKLEVKLNDKVIGTYIGLDALNTQEINLSDIIGEAGTYVLSYTLNDGIADEISGKFESPKSSYEFRTFKVASLSASISGGREGSSKTYYYTDYVKGIYHTKLTVKFEENDNKDATYKILANGTTLISAERENLNEKVFDLSEALSDGSFLDGNIRLSYIIDSEGTEREIGTYEFIRNDKPEISNILIQSAKEGYYFFGKENITDSLRTTLSFSLVDNVQFDDNKNNLKLKIVDGKEYTSPQVTLFTGDEALGNKTYDLSERILNAGTYSFAYMIDDGIGDIVKVIPSDSYAFREYKLPTVRSSSITSRHISNTNYTGYVSENNSTRFKASVEPNTCNTVTSYKLFVGKDDSTKVLIDEIFVSSQDDLTADINLSNFVFNNDYLDGQFSFFYEINFAENEDPVVGEFENLSNTNFVLNTAPYVENIQLTGAQNNTIFYTKDVKEDLRTKLSYTLSDLNNDSNLTLKIYNDTNNNGVLDDGEEISSLSSNKVGTKTLDFTSLRLFHNNEQNVSLRYELNDAIGEIIDENIGIYSFTSNTKPGINNVNVENTFGNDLTIYYGDVSVNHQALLGFDVDKMLSNENVKAYFSSTNNAKLKEIPLNNEDLKYSSNLSTLNLSNSGDFAITISLDDNIADVQYFSLSKNGGVVPVSGNSLDEAASKGYKFPIRVNVAPKINKAQTVLSIPSINNGVIYTNDVRDDRRTKLSIKVDDDCFVSENLYSVIFGDTNYSFSEKYKKDNNLSTYDLALTNFDGEQEVYLVLDDGISDVQYVNLSGENIDVNGKSLLTFKKNDAPTFIGKLNVSNTQNNQIYYGDVNVPERISELTFTASKDCEYSINNAVYYSNKDYSNALFEDGYGSCTGNNEIKYNLTVHDYDKFNQNPSFNILVTLNDDIADVVTANSSTFTFIKNVRPVLSGDIDYGESLTGRKFGSIFVGLDDSAQIKQTLTLNLTEDSVKYGDYTYTLYQEDKKIDSKVSSNSVAPEFDLSDYGKKNEFNASSNSSLRISYSDGIWDSSIAGDDFIKSNIRFSKAGVPDAEVSLSGLYEYNNKLFIYDKSMDKKCVDLITPNGDYFKEVTFSAFPKSSNSEIALNEASLEFTMSGADVQSESGWSSVTGEDRKTSLFTIDDFTSDEVVSKTWVNNTGNDNKLVKFRLKIVDELGQKVFIPFETDNKDIYLAREYAPSYPNKFLIYEGDSTKPLSNYTLEKGKTYRFEWSKANDVNISQGDDIVGYKFTITTEDGSTSEDVPIIEVVNNVAGIKKWTCEKEGSVSFSVSAMDKFGMQSRAKTISKDSVKNTNPNDLDPGTISSTVTKTNGLEYLKVYTSDSSQTILETSYVLSWVNAGDDDEGDYVNKWLIEYSTDRETWHELGYKDNTGNIVKTGEVVSYNYTLRSSLEDLENASEITFRIRAIDNRSNAESEAIEGNTYKFTFDNKKPVWKDLDDGKISFHSSEGYALTIEANITDASDILYVKINDEDIPFEKTENGVTFTFNTYKNDLYKFRISDIYNNVLSFNQNVTGIDSVPPTVNLVPDESAYTNKAYKLNIVCVDSVTGIKKIKVEYTDFDGKVSTFESHNEFVVGSQQVEFKYDVFGPGTYKVTVSDRADNETVETIEINNINMNKPTATYSLPEGLQNKSEIISLDATVVGTKLTTGLGSWSVLQTGTIKNYGEIKTTSVDATDATIEVFKNGTLDMVFTDIFGNTSDIVHITVDNILEGEVESDVTYLMLESDYNANYTEAAESVVINGVSYVKWNNQQTTSCQLYAYIKLKADFNGLQYAWIDSERSGKANATYTTIYEDESKPDAVLFRFNNARKAFYVVDIFGNYTQIVLTINGYVAPPACEIKYTILNEGVTSDKVDVYFEIVSGKFVDNGFYNITTSSGESKNLYDDFVWGSLVDGEFVADDTFKYKSFKYTFTENGQLKVWGQSSLDEGTYESVLVNISNIDKSVPIVTLEDYEKVLPKADSLTLNAATNGTFISLEELKVQINGFGYGLTEEELNSYKVSEDGKNASITLRHNVSGIFFYAKNSAGTLGNSESVSINNIYESNLSMDIWVYFEDGSCISYEEYLALEDKTSIGTVTVKAISTNVAKDNNGNYILRRFDESENTGCIITNSSYSDGGNMVTASYTFTSGGSYTFKLRDAYDGYLEKTITIGKISSGEDLPEIEISTENIKGENVPYVVAVKIKAVTYTDGAYFLDEEGNKTDKSSMEMTVTENGTYTFAVVDRFGNKVEKSITISNIFGRNSKPTIEVSYNEEFTNGELVVNAIVSNGKFVNIPSGWTTLSSINGSPVNIQKIFTKNETVTLSAKNFYDDDSSLISKKFNINNIDKEIPADADIDFDITSDGLLILTIIDNGDYGTSGTSKFKYQIYSDSSDYVMDGEIPVEENTIILNASDKNYRDGQYIIKMSVVDRAGNESYPVLKKFYCDNSLVKDFMSTYNTIVSSSNIDDMYDFYKQLVDDARSNLSNYKNDTQKQFVSDKCDLLDKILETGDAEQVILVSKIEAWLKELAKNPSDTSFVKELENSINSLTNSELQKKYRLQLDTLLNQNNIISLRENAPSEFNYAFEDYIINPLGGIVYKLNIAGHFNEFGEFVRGIDSNDYYYLKDGTKIMLDLTYKTFTDINGNVMNTETGLVNNSKYYDSLGNLVDTSIVGGFYDAFGFFHKTNWNGDPEIPEDKYYTVTFVDFDGRVIDTQTIKSGESAVAPENPSREGYVFVKWDKSFTEVKSDLTIMAVYKKQDSGEVITPTPTPSITPTPTPVPSITPTPTITPNPDEKIPVKSISLNKNSISVKVGDSFELIATISPSNATNKTLTWTSSNTSVAVVENGVVVPLNVGTTRITVTTHNNLSDSCLVKVSQAGTIIDDDNNIIIPPSTDYPTIGDIVTPVPSPDYEYGRAPSYYTGYLGSTMIGLTTETNYTTGNLRGFYDEGLSTLLYDGSGTIDISNKKNAYVNLGFKSGSYALVMNCIDINSSYTVNSFGLNASNGAVSINNNNSSSYGLGNNSYLVIFNSYSKDLTVAKNGTNISCDYDYDLQGYKVYNPTAGTYTLQPLNSNNIAPTDMASRYGFTNDTYSNPLTYKEVVKMAYNALNRDSGEELFSGIDKNSEIYREASILQKYGVISSIPSNVNSAIGGKDAYDIIYMTLSQTNAYNLNYNVSEYRYKTSISLQDFNNMVANIVQYF